MPSKHLRNATYASNIVKAGEQVTGPNGESYIVQEFLGRGSYSQVYKAAQLHPVPKRTVAIKIIDLKRLHESARQYVENEINVARALSHPSIVQTYDAWQSENQQIHIVMEHVAGGTLDDLCRSGNLEEKTAKRYFGQLLDAVDYCHRRGVRHRDIKPENILVEECGGSIKLCDFGLACILRDYQHSRLSPPLRNPVGTFTYRAPEIDSIDPDDGLSVGYSGSSADIFACGVVLYVMLNESGSSISDLHDAVRFICLRGQAEFAKDTGPPNPLCMKRYFKNVSLDAAQLLSLIICYEPGRVSIVDIKAHPWMLRE